MQNQLKRPAFVTQQKPAYDYLAPDASEVRLLIRPADGRAGLCHCLLPAGKTSVATLHQTVEEFWYFVAGQGELWLKEGSEEKIVPLQKGTAVSIPVNVPFQFRNTGTEPLEFVVTTMPDWPGPQEAVMVKGKW